MNKGRACAGLAERAIRAGHIPAGFSIRKWPLWVYRLGWRTACAYCSLLRDIPAETLVLERGELQRGEAAAAAVH
jgi:hypothetical protein